MSKPTRNTRKIANKLRTVSSDEINLQSKHDRTHVAKVKAAMSANSIAGVINFLVYLIVSSNPTLR